MLHGIDYEWAETVRKRNYAFLHEALGRINGLELNSEPGTFMYPLLLKNGGEIRKRLQSKKVYIPTLWPDVFGWCSADDTEYVMAENILPLPIDQRYTVEDMDYLKKEILKCTNI